MRLARGGDSKSSNLAGIIDGVSKTSRTSQGTDVMNRAAGIDEGVDLAAARFRVTCGVTVLVDIVDHRDGTAESADVIQRDFRRIGDRGKREHRARGECRCMTQQRRESFVHRFSPPCFASSVCEATPGVAASSFCARPKSGGS